MKLHRGRRRQQHAFGSLGDLIEKVQEVICVGRFGLSTWAETPEPTRSDSHAWSAHPNYDLLTVVAGIRPGSPGFKSVVIAPDLGQLKNVEAAMPHAKGEIAVSFARRERDVLAVITLPAELPGELHWNGLTIPLRAGKQEMTLEAGN